MSHYSSPLSPSCNKTNDYRYGGEYTFTSSSNKDGNSTLSKRAPLSPLPPRPPLSPLLQWTAGRRVCSEPSAGLVDSGRSSLTSFGGSQESLYSSNEGDDVFSDCCYSDDEVEDNYEHSFTGYLNKWKEWTVYATELQLNDTIISSTCKETVQRGYWHGTVWVHKRTIKRQQDVVSFAHEVNTLCKIRHENIQLFMGVCLDLPDNDTFGIIMSEVKGETLYSHLHKHGHNFTTPSKLKILRQISEGMEYLHAKGIYHGGLSSKLITLQHRVCISLSFHTMNHRKLEGFDLPYLPPDEVRSVSLLQKGHLFVPGNPTPVSDIFAFGTLTYELVTLKLPFKNQSLLDLVWNVGNYNCQSLASVPRGCFKSIITRCWSLTNRTTFKDILSSILRDDTTSFSRFRSGSSLSADLLCTAVRH